MPQKVINVPLILTSANNGQLLDLYTPSTENGYQMDGFIYDFFVNFQISSIAELPRESTIRPEGVALMTERELDLDFAERTKDAPSKILGIYYEINGVTINATKFLFYRQDPSYTEQMIPLLTQHKLAIKFGTKIKVRVEDFNSGLLGIDDIITFWLMGEEIKDLDIDTLAQRYL